MLYGFLAYLLLPIGFIWCLFSLVLEFYLHTLLWLFGEFDFMLVVKCPQYSDFGLTVSVEIKSMLQTFPNLQYVVLKAFLTYSYLFSSILQTEFRVLTLPRFPLSVDCSPFHHLLNHVLNGPLNCTGLLFACLSLLLHFIRLLL